MSQKRQILIVYIFLTVITFAAFWQVNNYDFINFDDKDYVTDNSYVRSGVTPEGFIWAFSTTQGQFWFPMTWLSFMFDYQLHGLNAGGYHLTNLVLHILSTLILFGLFNRMTGAIWKSAFVAAVFALHPLHVETVAWITKRKDVLSAFFWMLTLLLYVYYTEKPVIKRYLLVIVSFLFALMSKPMVVTLPVIMMLLDYWPLGRFQLKKGNLVSWQLKEKTPFFVLALIVSIITICVREKPFVESYPLYSRLANAPISFITYLEKTFWPHDMIVFYPFPVPIPIWQVLGALLLIIIISIAVIIMAKRLPYLFVGWLWYAITIMPVIGIIHVSSRAMSDNYTYLPSIGITIMLAWGIPLLFPREDRRKKILIPAGMAVLAVLAVLTWQQCGYWKNNITLYSHALRFSKNNTLMNNNLGLALFAEGKIEEAIDYYNNAIKINPVFFLPYQNRGIAYAKLGQYQRAIEDYDEVIRLKPDYSDAYSNKGIAYFKLGQHEQAFKNFKEAIRQNSYNAGAYNARGSSYAELGQYELAFEDFNKAISLERHNSSAYYNRGNAYLRLGQHQRAIDDLNESIRLKPNYADAYYLRGAVYFLLGINEQGCFDEQKACKLGECKLLEWAKGKGLCR